MNRFLIAWLTGLIGMTAHSDEGMWLFNEPPRERLKSAYGFELTDAWLDHARLSSIRFNNGGSGSFVSADGLIITNHHIGSDALQKLSRKDRDLLRDGFYARSRAQELKCPDLELNVLMEIEDVTARVNAAVGPDLSAAQAFAARRAVMSTIEKESLEKTKLRSDVVTLYQGGAYHLYRYKKYVDVRLVMAPEAGIAFFGGDTDNFEFPRFNLDICFFRAYENDQPVKLKHWLTFSPNGPAEGDLVFVTGHPGTTNRLETLAKLQHRRDRTLPFTLARLRAMEAALIQYGERGPEQKRRAATDLHRVANARKALSGQYQGLLKPETLKQKETAEQSLAAATRAQRDPELKKFKMLSNAVDRVSAIQKTYAEFEFAHNLIEVGTGFSSELFTIARHLVRMQTELPKPSSDRLREYRETNLDSLRMQLFSPAPIYPDLEQAKLQTSLTFLAETLGGAHPVVVRVLNGKNPAERAADLVRSSLADPAVRRKLHDGGLKAMSEIGDPMVELVLGLDGIARELRKKFEEMVEEPERQAYGDLARVRFTILGRSVAPDATFTLRMAYGTVRGYDAEDKTVPFRTTFGECFARAEEQQHTDPFRLPKRWMDGKAKVDPSTPFNFVSTADTIGGNSGSPVLNRQGEFIGINFDRNRFGLVRNFVYTDVQARHISVHSKGILEALRNLYDCPDLVRELVGK